MCDVDETTSGLTRWHQALFDCHVSPCTTPEKRSIPSDNEQTILHGSPKTSTHRYSLVDKGEHILSSLIVPRGRKI